MDPISGLTAALGTLAGKAVAASAIAAVSMGGLHAADVVDLPVLPDEAKTVVDTLPADGATVSDKASEGKARSDAEEETETEAEAEKVDTEEQDAADETDGGEPNENATFGQSVSDVARADDSTGETVSEYARTNNPGATPSEAGDRPDADVRQDETARQDAAARAGDDTTEDDAADDKAAEEGTVEEAPAEPGSQADAHRPATAGPGAADARS